MTITEKLSQYEVGQAATCPECGEDRPRTIFRRKGNELVCLACAGVTRGGQQATPDRHAIGAHRND